MFASHKFNKKSGVRYEVGVAIQSGFIAWINGPFPCGFWPDITIYRHTLQKWLPPGERCEADDGYVGESPHSIKCPCAVMAHPQEQDRMRAIVRHRHETANERLKNFSILSEPFRHDLTQHGYVFCACASLIQLSIEHGNPLFPVNYNPNVGI